MKEIVEQHFEGGKHVAKAKAPRFIYALEPDEDYVFFGDSLIVTKPDGQVKIIDKDGHVASLDGAPQGGSTFSLFNLFRGR